MQRRIGALQVFVGGVGAQREAQAVGRGRADQRRAAHLHRPDGVRGVVQRRQPQRREAVRQRSLVDGADRPAVGFEPDRTGGLAVDLHVAVIALRRNRNNIAHGFPRQPLTP